MGRRSTIPTLLDYCKSVSISDLKQHGLLLPGRSVRANFIWSRGGVKIASIALEVATYPPGPSYAEFAYFCAEKTVKYRVSMVSTPSNLGKGEIWYFICPRTGKRCRKLHLVDTYFLHRSAEPKALYELQTWSKETRLEATLPMYRGLSADHVYSELYGKYFKKTYRGKPTKRYIRLLARLSKLGEETPF